jgi:broad specificity phosphatase PhoE
MKHLYFTRHGQSVMNKSGLFSGRTDTPLNDEGKDQARQAGASLKGISIDTIVASPMSRTIETAQIIAEIIGFPIEQIMTNHFFTERDFGPLEGTPYIADLGEVDGVETIENVILRARRGMTFLRSLDADTILLVSHGAMGRAIRHCVDEHIPYRPSKGFDIGVVVKLV